MRKGLGRRSRKRRVMVYCLCILLLFTVVAVQLDNRLRPMIESYGLQSARRSGMLAVHDGVEQVLSEQQTAYNDLVVVSRNEDGRILSAEANVAAINLLKSRVTAQIIRRLQETGEQNIQIPVGNLLGGSFFVGRGPFLPFKIHSSGSIVTTIEDDFSDAGINQTCHRLYLVVSLSMTILLPLERKHLEMETTFLVCETVLVGEVPQTYANLELGGWPITAQTE